MSYVFEFTKLEKPFTLELQNQTSIKTFDYFRVNSQVEVFL